MDSNSIQLCRLCFESTRDVVNIFDKIEDSTIASILTQHFWFQVCKADGYSEYICQECWINTKTFHDFYKRVERLQNDNWHLAGVESHVIKEEPSDEPIFKPSVSLVKDEIIEAVPVLGFEIHKEESDDFSEDAQMKTDIGEGNVTVSSLPSAIAVNFNEKSDEDSDELDDRSPCSDLQGVGRVRLTLREKNAKIREFFSMNCQVCSEPFDNLSEAKKHYRTCHNTAGYVNCCGRKFHRISEAINHIFYHLNPDAYRCDICGKRLTDKRTLNSHMKSHEPDSSFTFECDSCHKSFRRESRLLAHKQYVHSPVKCTRCGIDYPSKSKLTTHLRNAHQSKNTIPQFCDICGKHFSSKQFFLIHMQSKHSTMERPKFQPKSKPDLVRHMLRHVESPVKCSICSKVLGNRFSLASHMRYVHVERRHRCTICDKKFRTSLTLKEHIAGHTGQDLYDCNYCGKTFKSSANMYSHRKKKHLAKWTEDNRKRTEKNSSETFDSIKMDSNSVQLCRLCLESSCDVVNVFDRFQDSTIASILTQHFWFQVCKYDGYSEYLCEICWINTKTFHNFYKRVECRQKDNWHLARVEAHEIKEEPIDSYTMEPNLPAVVAIDLPINKVETDDFSCDPNENFEQNVKMEIEFGERKVAENRLSPALSVRSNESNEEEDSDETEEGDDSNLNSSFDGINLSSKERNAKFREFFCMKCKICSEPYESFKGAKKHYRTVHKIQGLAHHIRVKHCSDEDKKFNCDKCDKIFASKSMLNYHIRADHEMLFTQVCEICARVFKNKNILQAHMKCHSTVPQETVQCDICGAWLKNKDGLRHHFRRHRESASAKCPICDKVLKNKTSLKMHIQYTHGEKRHQCTFCDKKFKKLLILKEHIAVHTGQHLYECAHCPKTFKSSANIEVVNVFDKFEDSTIASILTQHFWFIQVCKDDGYSEYLCQACWMNTKTFHTFYKRVECRQKENWDLAGLETHIVKEEPRFGPTLEPDLSLVKNEVTDPPVPVTHFQICEKESDNFNCGPNENLQMEIDAEDNNDIGNSLSSSYTSNSNESYDEVDLDDSNQNASFYGITLKEKNKKIREFYDMSCQICRETFESFNKIKNHYRAAHNVPGYVYCCGRKFHRFSLAFSHIFHHLNPDAFRCEVCDKRFSHKAAFQKHMKNHDPLDSTESLAYNRDICTNRSANILTQHLRLKHCSDEDKKFHCDKCNKNETASAELFAMDQYANDTKADVPPQIFESDDKALGQMMHKKSINRYRQAYEVFKKWQTSYGSTGYDEKTMMAYFASVEEKYSPNTMWSMYSMIRKTIIWKHNIDISKHSKLLSWLKQKNGGYKSTRSNVFEAEEISRFVVEAPNSSYLAMKVILAFGIMGIFRGSEVINLTIDNIKDNGDDIIVRVPSRKIKTSKVCVVDGEFTNIIREYLKLRPPNVPTNRLFLQYRDGKCTRQVMGKNTIANVPKEIAKFLELPNIKSYNCHAYRRSGMTIAADAGNDKLISGAIHLPSSSAKTAILRPMESSFVSASTTISRPMELPSTSATANISHPMQIW
ncbi:Transcription factor grauzone, partial [Pseudolycoriella hygida]